MGFVCIVGGAIAIFNPRLVPHTVLRAGLGLTVSVRGAAVECVKVAL